MLIHNQLSMQGCKQAFLVRYQMALISKGGSADNVPHARLVTLAPPMIPPDIPSCPRLVLQGQFFSSIHWVMCMFIDPVGRFARMWLPLTHPDDKVRPLTHHDRYKHGPVAL